MHGQPSRRGSGRGRRTATRVLAVLGLVSYPLLLGSVAAGPGHCAPATCLHWGLRRGEAYLDPMQWVLAGGPVVLLPAG